MNIPLLKYQSYPEELEAVKRLASSGRFIGGYPIENFEPYWARRVDAVNCVTTSSGTMALRLILRYLRSRSAARSRVIIPDFSFVATRDAVLEAGLSPVFVDVDENGLMDPGALMNTCRRSSGDVLAILPVHLYGQVVAITEIERVAQAFDIPYVVEDACQAHGALYADGSPVGSRNLTAWSFMPAKILGTWGDGGAITIPDSGSYKTEWFRSARNHGRSSDDKHTHNQYGTKGRMDSLKAAVLGKRLSRLEHFIRKRDEIVARYREELEGDLRFQPNSPGRVWSYAACWKNTSGRDDLVSFLNERGVGAGIHYPYILTESSVSCNFTAKRLANTTLTLPLWPEMSDDEVEKVIYTVRQFYL